MATLKIADLERTEELPRCDMVRLVGGDKKQPTGKPTYIDVERNILTFEDGSHWTTDMHG